MKKLLLIAMFMIVGCSESDTGTESYSDTGIELDVQKLDLDPSGDPLPSAISLGESSDVVKELSQKLVIKNSSSSPISLLNNLSSDPGFKIKLNRCGSSLPANSKCELVVAFANRGMFNGVNYTAELDITSQFQVILDASITGKPDPDNSGSANLEATIDGLYSSGVSYRTVTVVNNGTGTAKDILVEAPNGYSIRVNRCSSNLKPSQSCYVQIKYNSFRSPSPAPNELIVIASSTQADISLSTNPPSFVASLGSMSAPLVYLVDNAPPLPVGYQGSGVGSVGSPSSLTGTAGTVTNAVVAPVGAGASLSGSAVGATLTVNASASNSVTVNVTANEDITSCSNPYLSITACGVSSFAVNSSSITNLLASPASVLLNGQVNISVPAEKYTLKQVSNNNASGWPSDNIAPGSIIYNNELYFSAHDSAGFTKLFKINENDVVTQVTNVSPGASEFSTFSAAILNNELYVALTNASANRLYKLNTSGVLTYMYASAGSLFSDGSRIHFNYSPAMFQNETASIDASGIVTRSPDTNPGDNDSFSGGVIFNGHLYFRSNISGGNPKLHKRNLSTGATSLVANISPGTTDVVNPVSFIVFNNEFYFVASKPSIGQKLYKIDQFDVITQVSNMNANADVDSGNKMVIMNNELYFVGFTPASGKAIYKLNSSGVITQVLGSVLSNASTGVHLTVYKNELYFVNTNQKIAKVTADGHYMIITNMSNSLNDTEIKFMTVFNDAIYFSGARQANAPYHHKLFKLTKDF